MVHGLRVEEGDVSKLEKGTSDAGLEIIGKLAVVLEIEPAAPLRLPSSKGKRAGDSRCGLPVLASDPLPT